MSYCINIDLTFLLIILGYKKFINTFYHMHYYTNTMFVTRFSSWFRAEHRWCYKHSPQGEQEQASVLARGHTTAHASQAATLGQQRHAIAR